MIMNDLSQVTSFIPLLIFYWVNALRILSCLQKGGILLGLRAKIYLNVSSLVSLLIFMVFGYLIPVPAAE